jgi:hypothetical protein
LDFTWPCGVQYRHNEQYELCPVGATGEQGSWEVVMAVQYAFRPDDLESNASGQLTDTQRAMFKNGYFTMRLMPTVTGDLKSGAVATVEGALRKKKPINLSQSPESAGAQHYALEVGGEDYEVPSRRVWDEIPPMGWARLYYLPRSRVVVNLELLPDHDVETSPQDVVGTLRDAIGSALSPGLTKRSRIRRAERAAHAQAVVRSAFKGTPEISPDPTMPETAAPADLVGSWTSMFFNVEVRGDGTLTIENAQGVHQPGRWMVDADGQLHVCLDGGDSDDLVTPFTVSEDRLNLQFAGQEMTLERGV